MRLGKSSWLHWPKEDDNESPFVVFDDSFEHEEWLDEEHEERDPLGKLVLTMDVAHPGTLYSLIRQQLTPGAKATFMTY